MSITSTLSNAKAKRILDAGYESVGPQQPGKILVVGLLCGVYGRKLALAKLDAITKMKDECKSPTEVRRFLGAYAFYRIQIPHYTHIIEPCMGYSRRDRNSNGKKAHSGNDEVKGGIGSSNNFTKNCMQGRDAHLRDGIYESNWHRMGHQPRKRG